MTITRDVVIKVRVDAPSVAGTAGGTAAIRGGVAGVHAAGAAGMAGAGTAVGVGQGLGPGARPGPPSRPSIAPASVTAAGTTAVGGLFRQTVPIGISAAAVASAEQAPLTRAQRQVVAYQTAASLGVGAGGAYTSLAGAGRGNIDPLTGAVIPYAAVAGPGPSYAATAGAMAMAGLGAASSGVAGRGAVGIPSWQLMDPTHPNYIPGAAAYSYGMPGGAPGHGFKPRLSPRQVAMGAGAGATVATARAAAAAREWEELQKPRSGPLLGYGIPGSIPTHGFRGRAGSAIAAATAAGAGTRSAGAVAEEATGLFARMARAIGGANTAARQYNETLGKFAFEAARLLTWSRLITRTTWAAESPALTGMLGGISGRMIAGQAIRIGGPVSAGLWAVGALTGQFGLPEGWGGQGLLANPTLRDPAGGRAAGDIAARVFTANLWRPTMEADYLRQRNIDVLEGERRRRIEGASSAQATAARASMVSRGQMLRAQRLAANIPSFGGQLGVWNAMETSAVRQINQVQAEIDAGGPDIGSSQVRNVYSLRPGGVGQGFVAALGRVARLTGALTPGEVLPQPGQTYTQNQFERMPRYWQGQMIPFGTQGGRGWNTEELQTRFANISRLQQERVDVSQQRLQAVEKFTQMAVDAKREELTLARQVTQLRRDELQDVTKRRFGALVEGYFQPRRQREADIAFINRIRTGEVDYATLSPRERERLARVLPGLGPEGIAQVQAGIAAAPGMEAFAGAREAGASELTRAQRRAGHQALLEVGATEELMMAIADSQKRVLDNFNKLMEAMIAKQDADINQANAAGNNLPAPQE